MNQDPDLKKAAHAIEAFLEALGHSGSTNAELDGTGARVADAFATQLLKGYSMRAEDILSSRCAAIGEDWVALTSVDATMICPHHLLPASGVVDLAYLPNEELVGLGALAELVECRTRRLVLQEEATRGIVDDLVNVLGAKAAIARMEMRHGCLSDRGDGPRRASVRSLAFGAPDVDDAAERQLKLEGLAAIGGGPWT